jgi:uncharacterized protein
MPDVQQRADRRRRRLPQAEPRRVEPTTAVKAVLVALVLGAALNGPGLVTAATGLPLGTTREVAVTIASGVERGAAALGLDRPRRWLAGSGIGWLPDGALVATAGPGASAAAPAAAAGIPTPTPTWPTGGSAASAPSDLLAGTAPAPVDPSEPSEPSVARPRPVSAEDPLRVLLIGDSLIGAVGDGFGRLMDARDDVSWGSDVRVATGLARPDVLDWPAHLAEQLGARDPDVVVLMIGGNDDQSLLVPGGDPVHYGRDGWEQEYEARAARVMDIAGGDGRTVVWVTLPAMRPGRLDAARQLTNAAVERAAVGRDVVVVDAGQLVSPGGYAARVDGVQVRADDGVHLTHAGGDRVAPAIAAAIRERWGAP